ncbi:NADH:flavorubredoxin reductase NorW [Erwinia pyri]|uniref:NADH:flavorubredoxin reductase NorW n=1 Tax=Erwinia pyri TaxID=3062598 RepID=A0AA50HPY3_9GAMM|nr:NADH:flavorubredoxin reductase NorW [Erwinia sp. DE2]WLS80782.1 NADH:flavorubredoxin reductase NorW [Erwinia sp. DE2]
MSAEIVVIGSGFAARQLIKNLRYQDKNVPVRLIAADSCDEYNKPELSHVFSMGCHADSLTRQTAAEWAESQGIMLHPFTRVTAIDTAAHVVTTSAGDFSYGKLVLATGAQALVPAVKGSDFICTLNSQQEYRSYQAKLAEAERVLMIGGGLIGTELAMDFSRAGKSVTVVDRSSSLLSALLPPEIAARLQNRLMHSGVEFIFRSELTELSRYQDALQASFSNGLKRTFDAVVCAIGLRPDLTLARGAGIEVRHGVVVDETLATSAPDVYALGDCAEIAGKLLPYLQPATLAAMTLARNLTGNPAKLTLPAMLIKVKTPDMPLHLAGDPANASYRWEMALSPAGIIARGFDENDLLRAFVVSEDHMKLAFSMLKEIKLTGTNLL